MDEIIPSESRTLLFNLLWNLWFVVWGWINWQKLQKELLLHLDFGSLCRDLRNSSFTLWGGGGLCLIHILKKREKKEDQNVMR